MKIIEPHIHMFSRTTDDYQAMYEHGIRVVVEPSFWLGAPRSCAGSFYDNFQLILEFETTRASRFGIDHYACISVNPKEADNLKLAREVLAGIGPYLDHPRCVAVGEIGFNRITRNEEKVFQEQLELSLEKGLPVLIHSPHDTPEVSKRDGVERTVSILREMNYPMERVVIDHNTENTMDLARKCGAWAGLTIYPYSKLDPPRALEILKRWGVEHTLINSSADWGVSDPLTLPRMSRLLVENGFRADQVEQLLFQNPLDFYAQSGRFHPDLELPFIHPNVYQR
ncbi:MAG TPA: hydrolase TatD [Kiritimatiellae bacterium]|nr:hydrolase TatD [Kiritimatiellia bacterium]